MNADVAYEILRYFSPADRCRYRSIGRAFNQASLRWWRQESRVDVDQFAQSSRFKVLSFLRFLSANCAGSVRTVYISSDDRLFLAVVHAASSLSWGCDLVALLGNVETLGLRCLRMESYGGLAAFLKLFRNALSDLTINARYPMAVERWDGSETELCAAVVQLSRLDRVHLASMELKGDLLTCLNGNVSEVVITDCPDVEEHNLTTMSAWCRNLQQLRLHNVDIGLDTFHQLCSLPLLRSLDVLVNSRVEIDIDWALCVCGNDSIETATVAGRVEGSCGDLLDACPWPMLIGFDIQGQCTQSEVVCRLIIYNPRVAGSED